ncbi:glyoxal oxidase protein [Rutstroemia sp. NJR-2017a BBW]|nr:glyoxal oxidase protein [Rutstroemia sp. NJR-2017a BBW]
MVPGLTVRDAVYSTDGTCGPANGNTICDPKSTVYSGSCCSQYGWCGGDDAHCGAGCISGPCTTTSGGSSGTAPRADGRCGSSFETDIPRLLVVLHVMLKAHLVDAVRLMGTGLIELCRFCGSTADHCLVANGCQNGCTDGTSTLTTLPAASSSVPPSGPSSSATSSSQEPIIAPATSTLPAAVASSAPATTDGSCGVGNGNTVCGNWVNGNCCSLYGFCGNSSAHCGAGCQSGNCLSAPAVAAPGASPAPAAPQQGEFKIVGKSGVPAMHAALMPNGRVMFLDKLENYTDLTLPNGHYAMSSEYDPSTNGEAVPLAYTTNAFCSGGTFLKDGRVISVGGNAPLTWLDDTIGDGFDAIRYLDRSSTDASKNGQAWSEPGNKLASARWYATAQTMPDGTIFVASGSLNGLDPTVNSNNNPTYEILSADAVSQGKNIPLDILEKNQPYYMYPFVHLLNNGKLFIFTSKASQIFDVGANTIVKELPDLPGDYRTYPNTGGSVLLPLSSANQWNPDIVICGGGAYQDITSPTDPSCGRIQPLSTNPTWEMDSMPEGRGMVEGTLLADGTVVWLNGGDTGAQGFGLAKNPTLEALLYDPTKAKGQRFQTLAASTIPRLYHSVALLLLDGTLMVAGSNPVEMPKLQPDAADPYVTEFRVENYVPPYLQGDNANKRPTNVKLSSLDFKADGSTTTISFNCPAGAKAASVALYHGGFVTHSVHMGHRMLHLDVTGFNAGQTAQTLTVTRPPNNNVAPPGPYVVYVLVDGIPAVGQFVTV